MTAVNMLAGKTQLSRLVEAIIARYSDAIMLV
jgi:hypothetical protein